MKNIAVGVCGKKLLMTIALAAGLLTASAQDYQYLILQRKDGGTIAVRSSGLAITVSGGSLVVKSGNEAQTIEITSLKSMKFATDLTGISAVVADGTDIEVFTTAGVSLGRYKSADEAMKSISTPGVYLLRGRVETVKVLIEK